MKPQMARLRRRARWNRAFRAWSGRPRAALEIQRRDPATELGLARIADPEYPQVIANYANAFADGRRAKSTSIGIKDSSGRYVAALCMNIDLTLFRSLQSAMGQFIRVDADTARWKLSHGTWASRAPRCTKTRSDARAPTAAHPARSVISLMASRISTF